MSTSHTPHLISPQLLARHRANRMFQENLSGAHETINFSLVELNNTDPQIPVEFEKISESSKICVILYIIVFIFAFSGNCFTFKSLWRRQSTTQTRVRLLLMHLSLADILVCFTVIPIEIFWRLTIQWKGGNILCKAAQFFRAFSLYLSSFVLICISVDRYLAINFPLRSIPRVVYHRVKLMLIVAWTLSLICSVPQAIFFSVEKHPEFPQFEQCVTNDFINTPLEIQVYSIFSVVSLYFFPLVITLVTCCAVSYKLYLKSRRQVTQENASVWVINMTEMGNSNIFLIFARNMLALHNPVFTTMFNNNRLSRVQEEFKQQPKHFKSCK